MYWLDSLEVIGMCYSPPSSTVGQEFNLQPFSSTLTETNLIYLDSCMVYRERNVIHTSIGEIAGYIIFNYLHPGQ